MNKLRKILVLSMLAAGLAALQALLPATVQAATSPEVTVQAATSPEANVQAAISDDVSTFSSSSSTDCNDALGQQASGDWREAVKYIDKTDADDAQSYDQAYNHHKKPTVEDDDDDDDDDDEDDEEDDG
ncbi:MAG: hypothetical protein O3B21_00490 [Proteobacteria bacterium]|nr:hypothetical protein [Pseudomonadota bacterium]MDA1355865.1 hypothetical protein [Pseudomonadota bacterium]